MKHKLVLGVLLLVIFLVITFACFSQGAQKQLTLQNITEDRNSEDFILVVYCVNPFSLDTRYPWNSNKIEYLYESSNDGIVSKATITGSGLDSFFDSLSGIEHTYTISTNKDAYVGGKIYYYLWDNNGNKVLEVLLGQSEYVFVNNCYIPVEDGMGFYEIILPYLNDETAKNVADFIKSFKG